MPTVLFVMGWRFFFYAREGHEPMHIHAEKGEKDCKYWLDAENFDVEVAFAYNMNNKDKRQVKEIIFQHFDLLEKAWTEFQERRTS